MYPMDEDEYLASLPYNDGEYHPTVFFMGSPVHKCRAEGCTLEPHPLSDSIECADHTLASWKAELAETPDDEYVAEEIARWTRLAEVTQ